MDRTFSGHFDQPGALLVTELPIDMNFHFDAIDPAFLGLAIVAISGVDL